MPDWMTSMEVTTEPVLSGFRFWPCSRSFAKETYSAGDHIVQWSPADHGLAAGACFIRLSALGKVSVRTVIVFE